MPKVLVIDDENTILKNIEFVLGLEDYTVLTASDGEEGINLFKKNLNSIDVVITDMRMPKCSGMDVLKEVKSIMPEMSVIILTGHGDMENAILSMKEGAFEYLKKPVNADDLTIAINNAIIRKNLLLENSRMQRELLEHKNYLQGLHDSAQKILMNMLPEELPDLKGFRFGVEYKSSDAVGGDMYDICDIGNYICFYVFDVSSHGILASVITIILKSFIRNIEYNYRQGINKRRFPEIVADLNLELEANTAQNVFATLFLGFIDKKTKVFYYVSAGHVVQYLFNGETVESLPSTGTILGVFPDATYSCNVIPLKKGDKVLLFTDGIIEATSNDKMFGPDNLISILKNSHSKPIQSVTSEILETVSDFADGEFHDDVTLVGIEIVDV
ncbi:MAG: SpoIIE family protein phosphatase [Clostridia bacterium]|nr:SpoIIE family protein phosphatase [Clostridia bacterium]